MALNRIFIITTDFNGFVQTRRCLNALRASAYKAFKTIVVDHGTTGETEFGLAAEFQEVLRISAAPDLWWAGATNLGISRAIEQGADAIILINSDCYVDPETIGHLVTGANRSPHSIIASVQYDHASRRIVSIAPRSRLAWGLLTLPGPKRMTPEILSKELIPVGLIGGGRGVLIPASVIAKIGMLDERRLPHYYADHDLYFRAKQDSVRMLVATRASVYVDNSTTSAANNLGSLSTHEFWNTLFQRKSHRNLYDISTVFRLHYPVPSLYKAGVAMYLARYCLSYLAQRMLHVTRICLKRT